LQHAIYLKEILQHKSINAVIILVKFDNRLDDLVHTIFKQTKMISGYEQAILFIISHFDHAEKPL
jgi:hypothetical protein